MSISPDNKATTNPFFSGKTFVLSMALSIGSLILVAYYSYEPGLFERLHYKRLFGLGIALVVSVLRVLFFSWKLRYLSDNELTWMGSIRSALAWDFASFVTPSTIGGGPVAAFTMSKEGLSLGKSSAILIYGILLDQLWFALAIPMLLVAGTYYEIIPEAAGLIGRNSLFVVYVGLLSYAAILAYGVLVNPAFLKRVMGWVFKLPLVNRFEEKVMSEMDNLESYAESLRKKKFAFICKAFLISTLTWMTRIWLPSIVVLSFMPADVMLTFWRSLAMNLAFLVLPTPGGSGGVEALFTLFQGTIFTDMGRSHFIGLALFMWRFIAYYISFGLGTFAMSFYLKKTKDDITTSSNEAE